jgi:hypothetical protein
VNAITQIRPPAIPDDGRDGVNLSAIMRREGIRKIEDYGHTGMFLVVMQDGRSGADTNVGDALAKAKRDNAVRVA